MMIEAERDAGADRPPPDVGAAEAAPLDLVALYDAHAARVWRTALALGVEWRDVDDAVQDVFVVLHRRAGDFDGRSQVTTWIYGITRRVAADYRRRGRRAPRIVEQVDIAAPCAEQARHDAIQELLALLERLPAEQREVFVLIELEGMTAPEVAALIAAPVNTVSSRLRLARRALNEIALAARVADGGTP
jgi:RNA polymerase sigma-70 factor (ECF subfamily)